MAIKVKFGLKNVYYAVLTQAAPGDTPTYATPVRWPGAVNLTLDQEGSLDPFRADDTDYWISSSNNGYSGSFESALVPTSFRTAVLGETVDATSGMLYEDAGATTHQFALLFEVNGDANKTRHVLWNCTATRPSAGSQTTDSSITPVTESLDIRAAALIVGSQALVKGRVEESDTGYTNFFSAVLLPA